MASLLYSLRQTLDMIQFVPLWRIKGPTHARAEHHLLSDALEPRYCPNAVYSNLLIGLSSRRASSGATICLETRRIEEKISLRKHSNQSGGCQRETADAVFSRRVHLSMGDCLRWRSLVNESALNQDCYIYSIAWGLKGEIVY